MSLERFKLQLKLAGIDYSLLEKRFEEQDDVLYTWIEKETYAEDVVSRFHWDITPEGNSFWDNMYEHLARDDDALWDFLNILENIGIDYE